ncbi:MAG: hypothetical protein JST84_23105 [Acidobacteria bacterium]|nr:hypothetical protein [Acidobacteriota bacterium]
MALESTGVYWIPLFEVLEERGFEVRLVDARKAKNVSGRKSDLLVCQWLRQLHSYGLLAGAFRPAVEMLPLLAYLRQRQMLVLYAARQCQKSWLISCTSPKTKYERASAMRQIVKKVSWWCWREVAL